MAKNYLPQPLADLLSFSQNFSDLITASPGLYGLVAGDAVAIATANNAYAASYAESTNPGTRTKVTVQATVDARNALVQVIRGYGRLILANAGVSDVDKTDLGLIIRDPVKTPIPIPSTNPILAIVGATPGQLTVRYADSAAAPKIKAKPFGAASLELRVFIGTVAPVSPAATPYNGLYTKSPFALDTSDGTPGQTAFLYGRWLNAKGEAGPFSPLASSVIV